MFEFEEEIKRFRRNIVTGIQLGIVKGVIGMNMDGSKDKLYSQGNLNRNTLEKDSFIIKNQIPTYIMISPLH